MLLANETAAETLGLHIEVSGTKEPLRYGLIE